MGHAPPSRGVAGQTAPEDSWEAAGIDISPDEATVQGRLLFIDEEEDTAVDHGGMLRKTEQPWI